MLYDPNWEVETKPETKADPFALGTLIEWLEKQPADTRYEYCLKSECLIAQYLQAKGVEKYSLYSSEVEALGWMDIVNPMAVGAQHFTFGAALTRARKLAAEG